MLKKDVIAIAKALVKGEVTCEELNVKSQTYKSLKVSVPGNEASTLSNPELWSE